MSAIVGLAMPDTLSPLTADSTMWIVRELYRFIKSRRSHA